MLNVTMGAFACGSRTMRQVEEFGEDLPASMRRGLGLRGPVSDTALYAFLRKQDPSSMPDVVEAQVKEGLLKKAIRHDLFPMGVAAIDGKASWVGDHAADSCQRHVQEDGSPYWMLFAQRAVLVSSSVRPVLFQQFVGEKTNEMARFEECFLELNRRFGKSFEFVTSDAGACSRHNAQVVHDANKAYLFAVKDNQPSLHLWAKTLLGTKTDAKDAKKEGEARTVERYRGATITREIFRADVQHGDGEVDMPGARQLWRVRQTSVTKDDKCRVVEEAAEDRYFVTNRVLSAERALKLVRLHWGIENGANWTLDVAMGEDAGCPCAMGKGVVVVSWLRLLAYNLASLWRSKLPPSHGEPVTWKRAFELLARAVRSAEPVGTCATLG